MCELFVFLKHLTILLLIYSTLYTDSPDGSTYAVARHVSFAQIICFGTRVEFAVLAIYRFRCGCSILRLNLPDKKQIRCHAASPHLE